MSDISDDELVRMHLAGDEEAFNVLFDRHHTAVYNFALCMLRDVHRAEDVLQEIFVAAIRALPGYASRGRFKPWLMRMTRNRCLNRLESERARRVIASDPLLRVVKAESKDPSPRESAAQSDARALIRSAIEELPERQREAITLYAFEEMTYGEIAETLDMPINTVKTLIHRARGGLADRLGSWHKEQAS